MLALKKRPTELQAVSADERKLASDAMARTRTVRDFLAQDASQSQPGSPSSPLAQSPLARVAQRWQRAKLFEASSGLEEWARVRRWSTSSEVLAAETMQELTCARNILIGGRPVFLDPNADVKRIQPHFPSLCSEEPPRLRRLPAKHSDIPSAPRAPYDAVTPERGTILRMRFASPTVPPAPRLCVVPEKRGVGGAVSADEFSRRGSQSFSGTTKLFCVTGESRKERFARADASRGILNLTRASQARSCENSPLSRRAMSGDDPGKEFQPVRPRWGFEREVRHVALRWAEV